MELIINRGTTDIYRAQFTNPEMAAALSKIDGWQDIDAQVDAMVTSAANLPAPATEGAFREELLTQVRASKLDASKAATGYAKILAGWQVQAGLRALFEAIAQSLLAERDALIHAASDQLLTELNTQLLEIVEEFRKVSAVPDAASAARTGQIDSWRAKDEALKRYANLRQAQRTILGRWNLDTYDMCEYGFIKNSHDCWEDPKDHIAFLGRATRRDGRRVVRTPYPSDELAHAEWLTWIVNNPAAEPWVPTIAELEQRKEATHQLAQKARPTRGRHGGLIHHI